MVSVGTSADEKAAATLLWEVKAIATKEYESLPCSSKKNLFRQQDSPVQTLHQEPKKEPPWDHRKRGVSYDSTEMMPQTSSTPILPKSSAFFPATSSSPGQSSRGSTDHHDWSEGGDPVMDNTAKPQIMISFPQVNVEQKYGKRKRERFVGQTTKLGEVRATLKKKFSWKQYPELEEFLLSNQEEYFEHSSKNYTAEQRKYNNGLTRNLLDLAEEKGYVFEDFTFSMVRDRIRCYYKSHSQSAKKKKKR